MFALLCNRKRDKSLAIILLCLMSYCNNANGAPRPNIISYPTIQNLPNKLDQNYIKKDTVDDQSMKAKHQQLLAWLSAFNLNSGVASSATKIPQKIEPINKPTTLNIKKENVREGLNSQQTSNTINSGVTLAPASKPSTIVQPIVLSNPSNSLPTKLGITPGPILLPSQKPKVAVPPVLRPTFTIRDQKADSNTHQLHQNRPTLPNFQNILNGKPVSGQISTSVPSKFTSQSNANPTLSSKGVKKNTINLQPPRSMQFSQNRYRNHRYTKGPYGNRYIPRPNARPGYMPNRNFVSNQQRNMYQSPQRQFRDSRSYQGSVTSKKNSMKDIHLTLNRAIVQKNKSPIETETTPFQPEEDLMRLPRAILYPGGSCKLSSSHGQESNKIGKCRHLSSPCNVGEEAKERCGRYYRCCLPGNHSDPILKKKPMDHHSSLTTPPMKPLMDLLKLPRATLYPGGKCLLSSNYKNASQIGYCRLFSSPCNSGEEAHEMCGPYFKCCTSSNNVESLLRKPNHEISDKQNLNLLDFADVFPGGMCRILKKDKLRFGSCVSAHIGCNSVQNTLSDDNIQSKFEAVALCRSKYRSQHNLLCCAPGIENHERTGSSLDNAVHNITDNMDNNTPNKEKMDLPTISLI